MKGNNPTFDAVREYFSNPDWQASQTKDRPILNLQYKNSSNGTRQQWKCTAVVEEDLFDGKITFFSFLPLKTSRDTSDTKIEEIAELLHRINYVEDIGNFEISYEIGQVRCKTGIEVVISENIMPILIDSLVTNNIRLVKKYLPIIEQVNRGELTPVEAIDNNDN